MKAKRVKAQNFILQFLIPDKSEAMAIEIERKYLVLSQDYKDKAFGSFKIVQAYLSSSPERTVRVRIKGDRAFITVKGIGDSTGIKRFEWEKEISVEDALDLLRICEPHPITKIRYEVKFGDLIFEVDEFSDANMGLTIAEVELIDENQDFEKPDWLGQEVTGDPRYYNASLSKYPFSLWNE